MHLNTDQINTDIFILHFSFSFCITFYELINHFRINPNFVSIALAERNTIQTNNLLEWMPARKEWMCQQKLNRCGRRKHWSSDAWNLSHAEVSPAAPSAENTVTDATKPQQLQSAASGAGISKVFCGKTTILYKFFILAWHTFTRKPLKTRQKTIFEFERDKTAAWRS